ncbi:hypothetical protein A8B78_20675 [Jannaschia sp. EhC01]|nr:hypothetical protein A8B78_20675 [Jannaschia sp. EhC01]
MYLSKIIRNAALAVTLCFAAPIAATASTITVISESDIVANSFNNPFFDGFAGTGDTVTFLSSTSQGNSVLSRFRANRAQTFAPSPAALERSSLLVFAPVFGSNTLGTLGQLGLIRDYVANGGNLLFLADARFASNAATYNAFLESLGSSIRYNDAISRGTVRDGSLEDTDVSSSSQQLRPTNNVISTFFGLTGGETVATARVGTLVNGRFENAVETFVAYENLSPVAPIPLPAGFPMLLAGLVVIGGLRRRRRSAA